VAKGIGFHKIPVSARTLSRAVNGTLFLSSYFETTKSSIWPPAALNLARFDGIGIASKRNCI
jgi:hypothetical protein